MLFAGVSVVWAEATTLDPISGGAGWVGAGLLGLVLAWLLLRHLPAKDIQLAQFVAGKDKHVEEVLASSERRMELVTKTFRDETLAARAECKESLAFIMAQSEKHTNFLAQAMAQDFKTLTDKLAEHKA